MDSAKTTETMGYFTRDDIPWQYAWPTHYTICDQYFCSLNGPTMPNRLYQWSGTVDPAGKNGGPVTENPPDYKPVYSWKTYPERLHAAGISWKTYANDEVGDGDGDDGWVGDYGDNPMWLFHQYHDSYAATGSAQDLALRAALHDGWKPNSGRGQRPRLPAQPVHRRRRAEHAADGFLRRVALPVQRASPGPPG